MAELVTAVTSEEQMEEAFLAGSDALLLHGREIYGEDDALAGQRLEEYHVRGLHIYFSIDAPRNEEDILRFTEDIRMAAGVGASAIILQKIGAAYLAAKLCPELPLFAGSELGVTSLGYMEELRKAGFSRATAAKELNKYQIRHLKQYGSLPLTVVVQGEQCMSLDGLCSHRKEDGSCDGFCRDVFAFDGTGRQRNEYPLSLKDLCLAPHMREMAESGVDAFLLDRSVARENESFAETVCAYASMLQERRLPEPEETRLVNRIASNGGTTDGFYRGIVGRDMQGHPDSEYSLSTYGNAPQGNLPHRLTTRRRSIQLYFWARSGQPLMLAAEDSVGNRVMVQGNIPRYAEGKQHLVDTVRLRLAGGGYGDWSVIGTKIRIEDGVGFEPAEVEELKATCLYTLREKQYSIPGYDLHPYGEPEKSDSLRYEGKPQMVLSYRYFSQVDLSVNKAVPYFIYLPLAEIAADRKKAEDLMNCGIALAAILPMTITDNEREELLNLLKKVRSYGVRHAVVGSLSALELARAGGMLLRGDWGLAGRHWADLAALRSMGLSSVTLAYDQLLARIAEYSGRVGVDTELIVYGRLPVMLTENCIGRNHYGICDKCQSQRTILDRRGEPYPILGEPGCRNLVLDSRKLFLADQVQRMTGTGVRYFRLQFTTESASECNDVIEAYLTGGKSRYVPQRPWYGDYFS